MEVLYSENVTPLSQKLLMKKKLLGVNIDGPFQGNFFYRPPLYVAIQVFLL